MNIHSQSILKYRIGNKSYNIHKMSLVKKIKMEKVDFSSVQMWQER